MRWKHVVCLGIVLCLLCGSVSAAPKEHHWYCKHMNDGSTPPIPEEMQFIREHGGLWCNEEPDEEDKVIYLTFDAGYSNENLEKIVTVLREHEAHGAFFVLSHLVKDQTELVKQMQQDGHLICNHTAHHRNMARMTDEAAFRRELLELEETYTELTGLTLDRFYRPPEGAFTEENLRIAQDMGYATVFWSFAYSDWDNDSQPDPQKSLDQILANTHNGMILLLHPTSATNAAIMDELLTRWEEMGYRFGSLTELVP